jgi:hypothetical protein
MILDVFNDQGANVHMHAPFVSGKAGNIFPDLHGVMPKRMVQEVFVPWLAGKP